MENSRGCMLLSFLLNLKPWNITPSNFKGFMHKHFLWLFSLKVKYYNGCNATLFCDSSGCKQNGNGKWQRLHAPHPFQSIAGKWWVLSVTLWPSEISQWLYATLCCDSSGCNGKWQWLHAAHPFQSIAGATQAPLPPQFYQCTITVFGHASLFREISDLKLFLCK